MNSKEFIIGTISVIIIAMTAFTYSLKIKQQKIEEEPKHTCEQFEDWESTKRDCCYACDKFGYEFLKSVYFGAGWGRAGVNDCYCKDGNESKQIY